MDFDRETPLKINMCACDVTMAHVDLLSYMQHSGNNSEVAIIVRITVSGRKAVLCPSQISTFQVETSMLLGQSCLWFAGRFEVGRINCAPSYCLGFDVVKQGGANAGSGQPKDTHPFKGYDYLDLIVLNRLRSLAINIDSLFVPLRHSNFCRLVGYVVVEYHQEAAVRRLDQSRPDFIRRNHLLDGRD